MSNKSCFTQTSGSVGVSHPLRADHSHTRREGGRLTQRRAPPPAESVSVNLKSVLLVLNTSSPAALLSYWNLSRIRLREMAECPLQAALWAQRCRAQRLLDRREGGGGAQRFVRSHEKTAWRPCRLSADPRRMWCGAGCSTPVQSAVLLLPVSGMTFLVTQLWWLEVKQTSFPHMQFFLIL